ncbi:MAG: sulfatase-like hydrolase/transferase [Actinobacteria bacterium]|nr:sulfatase-like hydrolase/transferase [Actinomycetota bacterium]
MKRLGLAVVVLLLAPAPVARAAAPPNVLVILTDDQAWSMFSRHYMPTVYSELVDRGVLFTRGYVHTPSCCPSRAQILTGLYGHHSGVIYNSSPLTKPTFVKPLDDAGYRTMLAGKYLNSHDCSPLPSWDRWVCAGEGGSSYTKVDPTLNVDGNLIAHQGYTGRILADHAASFISESPEPFFVLYSPTTPHGPLNDDRRPFYPAPYVRAPSYDEDTASTGKPGYTHKPPLTDAQRLDWEAQWRKMARHVRALDDDLGVLLAAVPDDTLVVFLSDNGWLSGEHRWRGKGVPYEEAVRVPFVVRYPRASPGGWSTGALALNVDIASTIADAVGFDWVDDGKSLLPILTGEAGLVRTAALLGQCKGSAKLCPGTVGTSAPGFYGLVTRRWKYVEYGTGEKELYDLGADPYEITNRAGARPNLVNKLSAQMHALVGQAPS